MPSLMRLGYAGSQLESLLHSRRPAAELVESAAAVVVVIGGLNKGGHEGGFHGDGLGNNFFDRARKDFVAAGDDLDFPLENLHTISCDGPVGGFR